MKNLKKLSRKEMKSVKAGKRLSDTQECGDTCDANLICSPSCKGGCINGTCGPLG